MAIPITSPEIRPRPWPSDSHRKPSRTSTRRHTARSLTSEKILNWALAKVAQRRSELEAKAEREAKLAEEKAERVVQLVEEKAEREAQRAEERAQRAAKLAEEKAEREAQRTEERLEREREREHELELARLEAQSAASGSTSQSGCRPRERAPPMQKYEDDGKQPLDTYLRSFESLVAASDGTEAEKIRWLRLHAPPLGGFGQRTQCLAAEGL